MRGLVVAVLLASPAVLAAQAPHEFTRERDEYAAWLGTAPNSPFAAIAQQPIAAGLRLGPPDADIPLDGLPEHRVTEQGGAISLEGPDGRRALARGRPLPLGHFTISAAGAPGRGVITIFAGTGARKPAEYFDYDPSMPSTASTFTVPRLPRSAAR